jgi:hypothetical protein
MDRIVEIALTIGILFGLYKFSKFLKSLVIMFYNILQILCMVISTPLAWFVELFTVPLAVGMEWLALLTPAGKLSNRFSRLGQPRSVLFLMLCLAYLIVCSIVTLFLPNAMYIFDSIFYNTTIGACANMIINGAQPTWIDILNAGFASFLSYLFISQLLETDRTIGTVMGYIYHIVFFATASMLGFQLSGLFDILGNWGLTTFQNLSAVFGVPAPDFWAIVKMVGIGLALLVLGYLGLNLALVTIRDLIANIGFGLLALLFAFGGYLLLTLILPTSWQDGLIGDGAAYLLLIGTFLYAEHSRANPESGLLTEDDVADAEDAYYD